MRRIAGLGLLVLVALFGIRALGLGLQFSNRTVNISRKVTPESLRQKIVLDTGVLSIATTTSVPVNMSAGTTYSWSVNVTFGRVAISLRDDGATHWALNVSSPSLWKTDESSTVSDFPLRVQSTGLVVLWLDRSGAVGFNWSPKSSGVHQLVVENMYVLSNGIQTYSSCAIRVTVYAPIVVLSH